MAWAAALATIVGTGLEAYGQYQAGQEARKAHRQRSAALKSKAKATERAALEKGALLTERKIAELGSIKTKYAKGNVRVGVGSPLVVSAATAAQYEADKRVIGEEGVTEAGLARQGAGYELAMGESKYKAGLFGAGASLLTGGAGIMGKFKLGQKGKTFGVGFR